MKIISLNIWAGIVGQELIQFFEQNQDIDIFCLQEVMHNATEWTNWDERQNRNVFTDIQNALPNHTPYFRPTERGEWGLAVFVKGSIEIQEEGEIFIHREKDSMIAGDATTLPNNLQWLKIKDKNLTVCNMHGLWTGTGKSDTEMRLEQSKKIVSLLKEIGTEIILCGDFNLLPDTKSLQIIEKEVGLKNLIKEYAIASTRTSHYTKPDKHADYILISTGIIAKDFKVLPNEVSDHSPLYLEIE